MWARGWVTVRCSGSEEGVKDMWASAAKRNSRRNGNEAGWICSRQRCVRAALVSVTYF